MEDNDLKELVRAATRQEGDVSKLRCADAFALAAEHSVALPDILRVCNRENIRICECQLGCFA